MAKAIINGNKIAIIFSNIPNHNPLIQYNKEIINKPIKIFINL